MPFRLYQSHLDTVSRAVLEGDLATILQHIALPNMMSTRTKRVVATCPEEMDVIVSDIRAQLLARNVTEFRRTCIEANFVVGVPDMIVGRHRTEALSHGVPVLPEYAGSMAMMRINGTWQGIWLDTDADDLAVTMLSADFIEASDRVRRAVETGGPTGQPPMKGPDQ
jgi:hypothetical protein